MGLPWVRLDTGFPMNPKILGLVEDRQWRPIVTYIAGLAYSGQQGTDGFIPAGALAFIHATKRDAQALVDAGLWRPCPGGWEVPGWAEFQPSTEESQKRKKKAQDAAAARWRKQREKEEREQSGQAMLRALPEADATAHA
jgi:hypothetical protein